MRPSQAAKFVRAELAKAQKGAVKRRRECLFPLCKSQAIASHSQQKARELRAIAEEGHVYAVSVDWASALGNATPTVLTRQGIARATTFPGFCSDHDRRLFRSIDIGSLEPSERRAATYGLRALVHEMRKKQIAFETLCVSVPKLGDELGRPAVEHLVKSIDGLKAALENELPFYVDQFGLVATGAETNKLCFRWLTIDRALGISCTSAYSLLFKEHELRLLAGKSHSTHPVMTLSIVPEPRHTHVVAAWLQADDEHSAYIRGELENTSDLARLGLFLNRLAFAESENTTIKPSLWEGLEQEEKQRVVDCLREVAYRSHVLDSELPNVVRLSDEAITLHVFP